MRWVYDDSLPIYTQLVGQIKTAIVSGELQPGGKLPAVRELAIEAGVNPNTMQRAFQELERSGLVYTVRGSGRYVTDDVCAIDSERGKLAEEAINDFLENMQRLGYSAEQAAQAIAEQVKEEEI